MNQSAYIIRGDAEQTSIDTDQPVHIEGSVCPQISVAAGGAIEVGGTVQPGAVLNGKANVIVARGIEGEATQVVALGRVQAGHIRQSQIEAGGDICVDGAVEGARIRAGAQLQVGGAIGGGEAWATVRLQAAALGTASGERTIVGITAALETEARLAKVREGMEFCRTDILRIFRTLDLQTISRQDIAALFERTPAAKRKFVVDILKKLDELVQLRKKLLGKEAALLAESAQQLSKAEIKVEGKVYAGVQIHFGTATLEITQDLDGPSFCLTDEGIVLGSA